MECDFVIWIEITEGMTGAMKACFLILFLSNGKGSHHRDNGLLLNSAVSHQFEFSTLRSLPIKCEKAGKLFFVCYFIYCGYFYYYYFCCGRGAVGHSSRKHPVLGPRGRAGARDDSIGHLF